MSNLGTALRSRVVQSVLGAVVMVGLGAGWVTLSAQTSTSSTALTTDNPGQQVGAASAPSATATDDTSLTPTVTPTRRARSTETPTAPLQRTTPTQTPNGQQNRAGNIQSIDSTTQSFMLSSGNITTDGNTAYGGGISGFSALSVGEYVRVTCTLTPSGACLASRITHDD